MSNMTSENGGEQEDSSENDSEQYPGHLAGNRVEDTQEDGKHLRVVARTPHEAQASRIAAIGKTVAEVNDCPPDDPVYVCVYESTLDERFGAKWQNWQGAYLAFMVGNYGLQTYSFPATRLAKAEDRPAEKWKQAAEGDE
ncbi:hypothetical protein M201_gp73 [Haloarcula californiae tailed virus 2]|uniref:Uncharacterized protein n=1 Tax=Haloarcula californiae tailed virus 2 TaxID=1273747 RepID=R4TA73_9CAUD|nr:hypothetical protein M201_gp73 [Haloarcula californiae tailed virus 2]AGM11840.1 hypothetical protein HCTV2_71 [Haloarcula californiae tailed virus 2]